MDIAYNCGIFVPEFGTWQVSYRLDLHCTVQYNTIQNITGTVQYSKTQYSNVQNSTIQYSYSVGIVQYSITGNFLLNKMCLFNNNFVKIYFKLIFVTRSSRPYRPFLLGPCLWS